MNKVHNTKKIFNKKAVTLMEIMLAVVILAFTFIPVIGTLLSSARDTDVFNSYVFAQTTARNILDTLIDDVPFHSIRVGANNEASFVNSTIYNQSSHSNIPYDVTKFTEKLTNVRDERGTNYTVKIYVFPIEASEDDNNSTNELKFTYLTRPKYDQQENWFTFDNEVSKNSFRKDGTANPYDDGAFVCEEKKENAYKVGAKKHSDEKYSIMKRIVLTVEWTARDNHPRKIALYTLKANLDSEQ